MKSREWEQSLIYEDDFSCPIVDTIFNIIQFLFLEY